MTMWHQITRVDNARPHKWYHKAGMDIVLVEQDYFTGWLPFLMLNQ